MPEMDTDLSFALKLSESITCLVVDMENSLLYIGLNNGMISRIDLKTISILDRDQDVHSIVTGVNADAILSMVLLDHSLYTSGGMSSFVRVWDLNFTGSAADLDNSSALSILSRRGGRAFSSMLALSERTICGGGTDGDLWFIDVITNDVQVKESYPRRTSITSLVLLSKTNGNAILSCEDNGKLTIWDAVTRKKVMSINRTWLPVGCDPNDAYYSCLSMELDDGTICRSGLNQISIWRLKRPDGELLMDFRRCEDIRMITALIQLPTGGLLSGHFDGFLRAWNVQTGTCTHKFRMNDGAITSLVLGVSDSFISGSSDGTIRVWTTMIFLPLASFP